MTKLTFLDSTSPMWRKNVEIDTRDVLAVTNVRYECVENGKFAHRRDVYIKVPDATEGELPSVKIKSLYQITASSEIPSSIAVLDRMDGKSSFFRAAKVGDHHSMNASQLATADTITVSTDPADLAVMRLLDKHDTRHCSTGVSPAFSNSAKPETIPDGTLINFRKLCFGANQVLWVAHRDEGRFAGLPALTRG